MIAFKFLHAGGIAPFTGFRWIRGTWVSAPADGAPGSGVHACRLVDLPYWVDDELWRIELAGETVERKTQVEGRRGRLLERVSRWDPQAFADACAGRASAWAEAAKTPELLDYASWASRGKAGSAGFIAAVAAVAVRGGDRSAYAEERAWQARWLAQTLKLSDAM